MSPKKTSKAGRKPVGADPSDGKNTDEPGDLPASDGVDKSAESYDESLDAILLQAGARPPETASAKGLGSRTLMGIGIESLNLPGLRPAASSTDVPNQADETTTSEDGHDAPDADDDEKTLNLTAASVDDTQVTSLLDEVAQALNVQASEHRDRARSKLPGMTGSDSGASPPAATAPAPAAHPMTALTDGAEFEDPDDGPTSLTPGIISFGDAPKPEDMDLVGVSPEDEAVVLGPASANKSPAGGTESRSGKLPPIPGLSGPVAAPVGPPPGVSRTPTPPSGLQSGRVRQPTPAPGTPSLPPPPSGRLSLPPGMISAPVVPLPQSSQLDMNAPATLDASRRVSATLTGGRSDRMHKSGSGRVTQPVILANPGSSLPTMPTVLAAQVKIGTLSLAGLIAVTFAGGLLVGMLVWRGQGREPVRAEHVRVPGTAAPVITTAAAPAPVPAAGTPSPANVNAATIAPTAGVPAAAAGAAIVAAPVAPAKPAPGVSKEAVVTPIATTAGDGEPKAAPPPRAVAVRQPPRPRRPVTVPIVADTAALFPKAASNKPAAAPGASAASAAAPKTVASNAPAKPAPKAKGKPAWHDPFAD